MQYRQKKLVVFFYGRGGKFYAIRNDQSNRDHNKCSTFVKYSHGTHPGTINTGLRVIMVRKELDYNVKKVHTFRNGLRFFFSRNQLMSLCLCFSFTIWLWIAGSGAILKMKLKNPIF